MDKNYAAWAARWRVPAGFLLAVAYIVLCRPQRGILIAGAAVAMVGLFIRAYAAGCLNKNAALATGGPYARTRNPLYFGSFIMGAGFAVAGGVWYLGLALLGLFILIYWPVMRREGKFLRSEFGEDYTRYAAAVPFFFPAVRSGNLGGESFRWDQYFKNREYRAALGYAAAIAVLAAKMLLA
ncbi:MAG: isoprenylcysteine carboxylmethyltransferase family protein [Acidobacteria bacterium]|nr:isoprenylcysteine carboxylmethyltransferase family protein [Acidobacteriota bacterium]